MKYVLSREAKKDLEEIWIYTFENWSLKQADRYINLISSRFKHLIENPTLGKDYSQIRKGYFRSHIKSHYIFYKINRRKNIIEIIRVLHERMDIETRLND